MSAIEWFSDLYISEISFVNTYIAEKKNYPMKNPGRNRHGLLFVIEGTEIYHFYDKNISAAPNSILYIPKGESYTIDFIGEKSIVMVVDFEVVSKENIRPFCLKINHANDMKDYFVKIERSWLSKRPDSSVTYKALFYNILGLLIKQEFYYSSSDNYRKISEAVDYLHKHYLENNFKINTLYDISGISPRYFNTLFFKEFKTTPKEYIVSLKINQAKELLKSEKYSVTEVAFHLGYGDIYHFSKTFKAKTGYTPSEFRTSAFV